MHSPAQPGWVAAAISLLAIGCGPPSDAPRASATTTTTATVSAAGSASASSTLAATSGGVPSANAATPVGEDERVLEALILHMLRDSPPKEAVCLRVRGTKNELGDASDALLAAIRNARPGAVKASACEGGPPTGPWKVKASGAEAAMVDVGPIKWDGQVARVGGGGNLGRGGPHIREVEYELERAPTGWHVRSERVTAQN